MALVERDLNLTRRNSRSSAYSGSIKDTPPYPSSASAGNPDAVLSMLRTTTETGDLGSFGATPSRYPRLPNALGRRPKQAASSGLVASSSRASSHYSRAGSVRSAKSQRSARDAASDAGAPYNTRRFASSQEFAPANTTPAFLAGPDSGGRSLTMNSTGFLDHTDRAHSLTRDPPLPRNMADNRSVSSLRSQAYHHHQPWPGRPRSPFVVANRLTSAYRPVSPALSDTPSNYHRRGPPPPRPAAASRAYTSVSHPAGRYHHHHPDPLAMPPMPPMPPMLPMPAATPPPAVRVYGRPTRAFEDLRRPFQYGSNRPPQYEPLDHPRRPQPLRPIDHALPPARYVDYGFPSGPSPHNPVSPHPQQDYGTLSTNVSNYTGFVQRVKNVLEERISTDEARSPVGSIRGRRSPAIMDPDRTAPLSVVNDTRAADEQSSSNPSSCEEAEANESTGNSQVHVQPQEEEVVQMRRSGESAGEDAEGLDPDDPSIKRLTRDMIKAGMDGMSDIAELSDIGIDPPMDSSLDYEPRKNGGIADNPAVSSFAPAVDQSEATAQVVYEPIASPPPKDPRRDSSKLDFRRSMLRSASVHQSPTEDGQADNNPAANRIYEPQQDLTRPFSMPYQGLAADSRAPKTSAFKSMPPPSNSRMSMTTTVLDSDSEDEQKAIRLSTIQPPEQSSDMLPIKGDQESSEEAVSRSRRVSSAPASSTELISQSIIVSPPTTVTPSNAARNLGPRLSGGPEGGRLIPSASRSGALTVDQRASAIRNFNAPLPDLTEDSQEDASTTNLRMLGMKAPMFRPRQMREYRSPSRLSYEALAPPPVVHPGNPANSMMLPPSSYVNAKFADTRNIPSFNFSRVDLTTKLNKALGYRLSRSFEDFTQGSIRTGDVSNEDRPMSSNMARERYRSFFVFDESSEEGEEEAEHAPDPVADSTMKSTTRSLAIDQHILHEIDRLSIPSVKHLTSRLSELLPEIKQSQTEGDLRKVDEALKDTLSELKALGAAEKANAADTAGSLVRGETVTSSASERRSVQKRDRPCHLDKALPPLPRTDAEGSADEQEDSSGGESLQTAPEQTTNEVNVSQEESEAEGTAVDNTVSTMLDDLAKKADIAAGTPSKAQEAVRQEATPRPWNNQENYPWTNKTPPIKLKPQGSKDAADGQASEDAPAGEGLDTQEVLHVVRSMSPGFNDRDLVPVASGDAEKEAPSSGKKGLLKSLTQIVGLKPKASRSGPLIDPQFLHPEEAAESHSQTSSRRVDRGDRYPTTSLIAPDGMQVDDGVAPVDDGNRSFFSNDSSISDHSDHQGGGFRRRFTRFRAGRSNVQVESSQRPSENDSHSGGIRHAGIGSQPAVNVHGPSNYHDQDLEPLPGGMSKTEYHAKRLVEKLRYLIYKSGERLKNLTTPKKKSRFWYETTASENML